MLLLQPLHLSSSKNEVATSNVGIFIYQKRRRSQTLAEQDAAFLSYHICRGFKLYLCLLQCFGHIQFEIKLLYSVENQTVRRPTKIIVAALGYLSRIAVARVIEQFPIVNSKEEHLLHTNGRSISSIASGCLHRL